MASTGFRGADATELRGLAARMGGAADELDRIESLLRKQLHSAPWHGADADRARHDWDTWQRSAIRSAARWLHEAHTTLNRQAEQQEWATRSDQTAAGAFPNAGTSGSGDWVSRSSRALGFGAGVAGLFKRAVSPLDYLEKSAKTSRIGAKRLEQLTKAYARKVDSLARDLPSDVTRRLQDVEPRLRNLTKQTERVAERLKNVVHHVEHDPLADHVKFLKPLAHGPLKKMALGLVPGPVGLVMDGTLLADSIKKGDHLDELREGVSVALDIASFVPVVQDVAIPVSLIWDVGWEVHDAWPSFSKGMNAMTPILAQAGPLGSLVQPADPPAVVRSATTLDGFAAGSHSVAQAATTSLDPWRQR